ncbi:hypothetical protein QCA50_008648 [Cerrena zonata]|uniref:C2H2-type domain-containing protein n=1 Tax=Cerrena zonata TaxID=2478898 RepID=A0AAW0GE20_9APHY
MSTLTVHEELHGLPGSSRCPHEQCKLEFDDYAKLYAHLWHHKGLPEATFPIYYSCSWPECSEDVRGEQLVLFHLMRHVQAMRYICTHLTKWEPGNRTLCKKKFSCQEALDLHRSSRHGFLDQHNQAVHPWVHELGVPLDNAELIGLKREDGEQTQVEPMLRIEDGDGQQYGPDDRLNHEQEPIPIVAQEQNVDHLGQDLFRVGDNRVLSNHDQQFEDWLHALSFPIGPYEHPQAFEVAVQPQGGNNFLGDLSTPAVPPAFDNNMVPQDFGFPYADQLAAGDVGDDVFQQAPDIGMMAQVYQPADNAAWDRLQKLFNIPFANQDPMVNADVYGNQQFGPLAVAPYPLPMGDFPNTQEAAPEHNIPVIQPSSVFVPSSNPAPCSTAVAMLALSQPNMGLQALAVGQTVHVLLRLEGVNDPSQGFPYKLDPNTGAYIHRQDRPGVTAQIVAANFANDNAGFQI